MTPEYKDGLVQNLLLSAREAALLIEGIHKHPERSATLSRLKIAITAMEKSQ